MIFQAKNITKYQLTFIGFYKIYPNLSAYDVKEYYLIKKYSQCLQIFWKSVTL